MAKEYVIEFKNGSKILIPLDDPEKLIREFQDKGLKEWVLIRTDDGPYLFRSDEILGMWPILPFKTTGDVRNG